MAHMLHTQGPMTVMLMSCSNKTCMKKKLNLNTNNAGIEPSHPFPTPIINGGPRSNIMQHLHNNTRSRRPMTTTVLSNDTLVDTPFQLISGFFHVNQGVLCSEHAKQASSRGVLEGGGGEQAC